MDCQTARTILAPEPGPRESTATVQDAFSHYSGCEDCRDFFLSHRRVAERAAAAGHTVRAPASLRERIVAAMGREFADRPRRGLWFGGVAVAAAAVLGLYLGPTPSYLKSSQPFVAQALAIRSPNVALETEQPEPLRDWFISRAIDDFEIPDIPSAHLWRGRVTSVGGKRSPAVDFSLPTGEQITYIVVPGTDVFQGVTESDIMTMSDEGWEVAMWVENGSARAVVSTIDREELVAIAEHCRNKASL